MPKRRVNRQRQAKNQSCGFVVLFLTIMFLIIILIGMVGQVVGYLNSPAKQTLIATFTIGISLFCMWRYSRKRVQKQQTIAKQQEYAWQQWEEQKRIRIGQERMLLEREQRGREHAKQEQERMLLEREQRERERVEQEKEEQERIKQMKSLGDLLALTPREFEELTGKILVSDGFHDVHRVGGSGDLGADLVARNMNGERVIVQCKRYAPGNTIGSPTIQTFIGMMCVHHKVEQGIFVTTSTFTLPATELAKEHNIRLIRGDQLVVLVQKMGYRAKDMEILSEAASPLAIPRDLPDSHKEIFTTSSDSTQVTPIPTLLSGPSTNTINIYDFAGVLDASKVRNEASLLPCAIDIYTTTNFTGSKEQFIHETTHQVHKNNLVVLAIDPRNRYVYLDGRGVSLSMKHYQDAVNAFSNTFLSGGHTAATVSAIDSLKSSFNGVSSSLFSQSLVG